VAEINITRVMSQLKKVPRKFIKAKKIAQIKRKKVKQSCLHQIGFIKMGSPLLRSLIYL
jgi:hypothetical protein